MKKEVPIFHSARERINFYFEDVYTRQGRIIDFAIIMLILVSSLLYVLLSLKLPDNILRILIVLDGSIMVVFTIEYVIRLWVAEKKIKHVLNVYSLIDLVAILPFYLNATGWGFVRLARVFRVLRLVRYAHKKYLFWKMTSEETYIMSRILFTAFLLIFVSSGLIFQIEHPDNPSVETFYDAMYYTVTTISTVGFGDIAPLSTEGRLVTIIMILGGAIIIPWQLTHFFMRIVDKAGKVRNRCQKCHLAYHEADAKYCRHCGKRLRSLA